VSRGILEEQGSRIGIWHTIGGDQEIEPRPQTTLGAWSPRRETPAAKKQQQSRSSWPAETQALTLEPRYDISTTWPHLGEYPVGRPIGGGKDMPRRIEEMTRGEILKEFEGGEEKK